MRSLRGFPGRTHCQFFMITPRGTDLLETCNQDGPYINSGVTDELVHAVGGFDLLAGSVEVGDRLRVEGDDLWWSAFVVHVGDVISWRSDGPTYDIPDPILDMIADIKATA